MGTVASSGDLFRDVREAFMPLTTVGDVQGAIDTAILGVAGPVAAALAAQAAAEAAQAAAEVAQTAAETAETNAETAETNAETAETNSETAQTASETAQGLAETAKTGAETAQGLAETAQTAAETAETNAELAETNAETAQTAAEAAQVIVQAAAAFTGLFVVLDEVIDMLTTPAASWDLSIDIPVGSVIMSVQVNLQDDITAAGGATKIGVGVAATPDLYGKTTGVTQNLKVDTIPVHAILAGAEDIKLFAVDNAGDAAGTIGGGGAGTDEVRVKIVYQQLTSLPNV